MMPHKCLVGFVAQRLADCFEAISVRYVCCISIMDEDKNPHNVENHPNDSCFVRALLMIKSFVNNSED